MLRSKHHRRPGLTLMELVVVLVILAALAMLVIPRLGFIKDQADFAQSAAGSADVMSNLELFKTQTGLYPGKLDSLIEGSALLTTLWGHGAPPSWIVPEALGAGYSTNFSHSFGSGLMQHVVAGADPSSSGTAQVSVTSSTLVARVVPGTKQAVAAGYANNSTPGTDEIPDNPDTPENEFQAAVPGTAASLPAGVKLIALGVGPRNSAVGKTMTSAPQHAGASPTNYARYIAIFAIYDTTARKAELRAVVDSRGYLIDERLSSFRQSVPNAN